LNRGAGLCDNGSPREFRRVHLEAFHQLLCAEDTVGINIYLLLQIIRILPELLIITQAAAR
jgi:hypothetical protein